ncbi:hypothetical protein P7C73_g4269, partial [Tremellales sp. Uapishka_1]
MDLLGLSRPVDTSPVPGAEYLRTLHTYLKTNLSRLSPSKGSPPTPSMLAQSYTLLTLGLDPSSAPLSRNITVPLTLGFADPTPPKAPSVKPLLLRLPPDRLLYLLLRWQSLPQGLGHVGRTDVPLEAGISVHARGGKVEGRARGDGEVGSVRSWVGSMRSVSADAGMGWWRKKKVESEDEILLALYSIFTILPSLVIHPPFSSDRPISELVDAGGYTHLGGIDVRVPLDVLRNLQVLELESYDPRALLIPLKPALRSLTVRDVQDGDDWISELLALPPTTDDPTPQPRFPNLRHLSLPSTTLLTFPSLPLSRLTSLDLSSNLLNALPSSLSSLSSLTSLNLSNNVITSVRNAPSVLGNIASINLSNNRINCLIGLERVLGLKRIDVRGNTMVDHQEVGRLAVLPHVREIWTTGNPFDTQSTSDDWRIDLGVTFLSENNEILLDDREFTWSERRRIDAVLVSRGQGIITQTHTPQNSIAVRNTTPTNRPSRPPSVAGPSPSPSSAVPKRRRKRRVIKLDDGDGGGEDDSEPEIGGSLRLPKTAEEDEEGEPDVQGGAERKSKSEKRRTRVSASLYEPTTPGL